MISLKGYLEFTLQNFEYTAYHGTSVVDIVFANCN
jgi:hypothetical protein